MNIRKLIMTATVVAMTLATTTCFAMIPISELNIGGIYLDMPLSEVINKFGQPIKKEQGMPKGYIYTFRNGNSTFSVKPAGDNTIEYMDILDNSMLTKAGIGIGSTYADVKAIYGEPDSIGDYNWGRGLLYSAGVREGRYGECVLEFVLDSSNGRVKQMGFNVMMIEGQPIGTGKPMHIPPQSQPQEPTKPKSPIPDPITQIPASELNLGWIEPGQPMSKVEQVYGKPGKIDDQGFFQIYNYNDKFIVKGKMNNGYKVTSVATYEKGVKIPSGFMVGDAYSAVTKKFGAVNAIKYKGEELEAKMKNLKGCTDYTYFCGKKQMVFLVDKKGIIQAIRVEDYDEQKFIDARRKK